MPLCNLVCLDWQRAPAASQHSKLLDLTQTFDVESNRCKCKSYVADWLESVNINECRASISTVHNLIYA